jgi:hypothetical protein
MDDCLRWADIWKITGKVRIFGCFFSRLRLFSNFEQKCIGIHLGDFSQTVLNVSIKNRFEAVA